MFGILFAVFCGLALVRLWRRPYMVGPGYGWGCGGGWDRRNGGDPFHARAWSRGVMRDVDATPSQERAIHDAEAEVLDAARRRRRAWGLSDTIADALDADTFDRHTVAARLGHDDADPFRESVLSAIERLHAALEPAQRRTIATRVRGTQRFND